MRYSGQILVSVWPVFLSKTVKNVNLYFLGSSAIAEENGALVIYPFFWHFKKIQNLRQIWKKLSKCGGSPRRNSRWEYPADTFDLFSRENRSDCDIYALNCYFLINSLRIYINVLSGITRRFPRPPSFGPWPSIATGWFRSSGTRCFTYTHTCR